MIACERMCWIVAVPLVAAVLLAGPVAAAQSPDEQERARETHERGMAALESQKFAEARDHFLEALRLHPGQGSAFNLGLAYRGTGQAGKAIDIWERLLAGEFGEVPESARTEVRTLIEEMRQARGRIEVRLEAPDTATVLLDGEDRGSVRSSDPRVFEVDAGQRLLRLQAEDHLPAERSVTVQGGATKIERFVLEAAADESPEPGRESTPLWREPALWGVTGAILAVGAAAVAIGLTAPYERDPMSRQPFGVAESLRTP